jgi:hypothetical protein
MLILRETQRTENPREVMPYSQETALYRGPRKQTIVALSSTEAEYVVLSEATRSSMDTAIPPRDRTQV